MKNKPMLFSVLTITFLVILIALSIIFNFPIFLAILGGSIPGLYYILISDIDLNHLLKEIFKSLKSIRNIFILLSIIGVYIPLLGKSQSIHALIYGFTPILENFPLTFSAFLLTLILSMILGTAVGTLSILSPLFLSIASLSSISTPMVVGALVSGAYFGDRASYLSTSANLTASVTNTSLLNTVPRMLKDSILPFLISCVLFYLITPVPEISNDILKNLKVDFNIEFWMILPVLILLLMIVFKVPVLKSISVSTGLALILSFFTIGNISFDMIFYGYKSPIEKYAYLLNTSGFLNMISVLLVILSSAFLNGVMKASQLIKTLLAPILNKSNNFYTIITNTSLTAVILTLITCNQTLTSIMTGDNFKDLYDNKNIDRVLLASTIGNTGLGIVGIIPWNVNGLLVTALTGVSTINYFKWSFFPLLLIIYAFTLQPLIYKKSQNK